MIKHNLLSYAGCRQFFLTDFVMRSNVRFGEDIISEDVPFTVNAMLACQKLCYLRKEMYVYCHRWGSLSQNRLTWKNLYSAFKIFMEFFDIWLYSANDAQRREAMVYLYRHLLAYCKNIYMRLPLEERSRAKESISVDARAAELFDLLVEENLEGNYVQEISPEKLKRIRSYLKIIIYGAGNYAVDLYLLLKKQYINIMGFAVTERSRNVALIDGKPVLPAEEWMWDRDEALILLGCSDSFKERVVKHLDELGFGNVMSV